MKQIILLLKRATGISLFGILVMGGDGIAMENVYYMEYVFKIVNGACVDEQFYMVPVRDEYRMQEFRVFRVKGAVRRNSGNLAMSRPVAPQTAARHDALCRLLVQEGQMSLKSDRCFENRKGVDEIVFRYQGFAQYPFHLIHQGYQKENGTFETELQIRFASVALPGQWSSLYRRKQLRETLEELKSWF
jgi:hypothetical protein